MFKSVLTLEYDNGSQKFWQRLLYAMTHSRVRGTKRTTTKHAKDSVELNNVSQYPVTSGFENPVLC